VLVHGNADTIGRAVRNLVENALAHTPKGSTVEIELTAPGSIAVSDSGAGVSPELRAKIFQRFFRVDRRKDGAGLGLAIVAKVAETHGGRVRVADAPGGGARFLLELPPLDAPSQAEAEGERMETKSRQIA
jgi:signal transduction histidine kinase